MKQIELDKTVLALAEKDPIFFAKVLLGINLNPFQIRFFEEVMRGNRQILVVSSNQIGKTVAIAVLHIWDNFFKRRIFGDKELLKSAYYSTLNVSPISRQSKEAYRTVLEILGNNFSWEENGKRYVNKCRIDWFLKDKNETLGKIGFSNNTAFYCLSTRADEGAGLQGSQFGLITYDEAPQSHHLQEELPARILSRTAKYAGTVILVGTPDDLAPSQQYWFHLASEAIKRKGSWSLVRGKYDENIFIPEKVRTEYKDRLKKMSPLHYYQVTEGKFITSAIKMFSPEIIEALWIPERMSPTPAREGNEYVISVDWGIADSGDETVFLVADISLPLDIIVVNSYSKKGGDPVSLMTTLNLFRQAYNEAVVIMDTSSLGGVIFKKMLSHMKPISFDYAYKNDALTYLQIYLRNRYRLRGKTYEEIEKELAQLDTGIVSSYYLPKLEEEMANYRIQDTKIKQDWVMALAQLIWYVQRYKRVSKAKTYSLNWFRKYDKPIDK